jgi:hypothetical protein
MPKGYGKPFIIFLCALCCGIFRAAEKDNYPVLLVFRPDYCVAPSGEYTRYSPLEAPCIRTEIQRILGILISFRGPDFSSL